MNVRIIAESQVNPTEDRLKVERALLNVFPSGKVEGIRVGEDVIRLRVAGDGLEFLSRLRSLIKQERIRSAARSIILGRTRGNKIHLHLNKQAAFAGRVSFCEPTGESPHGPISVEIDTDSPDAVVDFLATRQGFQTREAPQGER